LKDPLLDLESTRENGFAKAIHWPGYILALVISDLVMVGMGFRLAYLVRFDLSIPIFRLEVAPSLSYYLMLVGVMIPIWIGIFAAGGLYHRQNLLGGTREYALVFRATTIGVMAVIIAGFLGPEFVIARGWLLLSWLLSFLLAALGRFLLRRVVYGLRRFGLFVTPAILVGGNEEARVLAEQLQEWNTSGLNLIGYVDETQDPKSPLHENLPYLGKIDQLDDLIQKGNVGEVIVATSSIPRESILTIFKQHGFSDGVNVRLSSGLFEIITTGIQVSEYASVPLVRVNKVRLMGVDRVLKDLLDYGLAIPGLIFILPILALIALVIRLDSPGPIIHRRRVMGVNGKQFDAYKFRSMHVNGDEILEQHPELVKELAENHKLKDDPRITRVGRFLRKYSLDELPQLFNVLKYEMSLVGPRMISPDEMAKYNQWGINLLTVRPGITGLWQVSGRSDIGYEDRVRLDMYYIRNWTVWMDLSLLIRTLPAAISSRGAY